MSSPPIQIYPGKGLTSVVYRSTPSSPLGGDDLFDLSTKSAEANKRSNITGYLTYRSGRFAPGRFMQYFEGTGDDVNALYARLAADPRHAIEVAVTLRVKKRRFPDWSMQLLDPLWYPTAGALDAIDELLQGSTSGEEDHVVVDALELLVDRVRIGR